jgi:hypothetical protein
MAGAGIAGARPSPRDVRSTLRLRASKRPGSTRTSPGQVSLCHTSVVPTIGDGAHRTIVCRSTRSPRGRDILMISCTEATPKGECQSLDGLLQPPRIADRHGGVSRPAGCRLCRNAVRWLGDDFMPVAGREEGAPPEHPAERRRMRTASRGRLSFGRPLLWSAIAFPHGAAGEPDHAWCPRP